MHVIMVTACVIRNKYLKLIFKMLGNVLHLFKAVCLIAYWHIITLFLLLHISRISHFL